MKILKISKEASNTRKILQAPIKEGDVIGKSHLYFKRRNDRYSTDRFLPRLLKKASCMDYIRHVFGKFLFSKPDICYFFLLFSNVPYLKLSFPSYLKINLFNASAFAEDDNDVLPASCITRHEPTLNFPTRRSTIIAIDRNLKLMDLRCTHCYNILTILNDLIIRKVCRYILQKFICKF